jgi:hypothetical protein
LEKCGSAARKRDKVINFEPHRSLKSASHPFSNSDGMINEVACLSFQTNVNMRKPTSFFNKNLDVMSDLQGLSTSPPSLHIKQSVAIVVTDYGMVNHLSLIFGDRDNTRGVPSNLSNGAACQRVETDHMIVVMGCVEDVEVMIRDLKPMLIISMGTDETWTLHICPGDVVVASSFYDMDAHTEHRAYLSESLKRLVEQIITTSSWTDFIKFARPPSTRVEKEAFLRVFYDAPGPVVPNGVSLAATRILRELYSEIHIPFQESWPDLWDIQWCPDGAYQLRPEIRQEIDAILKVPHGVYPRRDPLLPRAYAGRCLMSSRAPSTPDEVPNDVDFDITSVEIASVLHHVETYNQTGGQQMASSAPIHFLAVRGIHTYWTSPESSQYAQYARHVATAWVCALVDALDRRAELI